MAARSPSASGTRSWRRRRDELLGRPDLAADELDELADAWFWLDDPEQSMAIRRRAYQRHAELGDDGAAAYAAWRLFADHHLVGESAPASGWLERCRRHVEAGAGPAAAGWLAIAEADRASTVGDHRRALGYAGAGEEHGRRSGDRDLTAMAIQAAARAQIALGDREVGVRRLDEAMIAVTNGELGDLYTGWVYCNVVSTCYAIGDLRRASEWSTAAMHWCSTLREGLMYPGLCRVYAVELAYLRGDWQVAMLDAQRASDELTAYDPRYAGTAFLLVGDFHRVRGSLDEAEMAYTRAHRLGVAPQPGRALVQLARGHADRAMGSLRTAWDTSPTAPLPRAQLLAAIAEVAATVADADALDQAVAELDEIGEASGSALIEAIAGAARGIRSLDRDDAADAVTSLRSATDALHRLGFPYESARRRLWLADALVAAGDPDGADMELRGAIVDLERLEAGPDLEAARARLRRADSDEAHSDHDVSCPLSPRELDVLHLVAAGRTDGEIADELVISHHTVARHVSNIRTKLGVASRAAATAMASEQGWLRSPLA